jgi:hypothetical protein
MPSVLAAPLLQQYFKHLYGKVGQEGEDATEAAAAAAAGAGARTPPAEDAAAAPPSPYLTDAPQYQSLVAHSAPAATTSLAAALASPPPRSRLGSQPHAVEGSSDALHRMDDLTSSPHSSSYDLQSEASEHSLRR